MQNGISGLCSTCKQCTWQDQCGGPDPCLHFDPFDSDQYDQYIEDQYFGELAICKHRADLSAAEQGNLDRE